MTVLSTGRPHEPAPSSPRVGPLGRLARVTFRRRGRTVLAWLLALGVAVGLAASLGGDFKADYSAPGSDSQEAQTLLEDRFPSQAGDTVDVVVHADGGIQGQERGGAGPARRARLGGARRRRLRPVPGPGRREPGRHHAGGAPAPGRREPRRHAARGQRADARDRRRCLHRRAPGRPGRAVHRAGRAGRDRLGGPRARSRGDHPAHHVRLARRGRAADPRRRGRTRRQQHADHRGDLLRRRPRLVDLAGHHDGHRHRHRLRAADGDPVP